MESEEDRCRQGGHKPGKPGIRRDFSEHGKLREFSGNFVQLQGKIVANSIFSSSFKYLCKTAVDCVNRIIRISGVATLPSEYQQCGDDLLYYWS